MTDNPLEGALRELAAFLDQEKIPYMIIGAVAGLAWGLRRATFDVDATIWAEGREVELAKLLSARFRPRVADPEKFVAETAVLPLVVAETDADIIFGRLPYEESAIRRAKRIPLGATELRICTAEDLIVYKVISQRLKDSQDIQTMAKALGPQLDRNYLDPIVRGLAADLARPDLWDKYLALLGSDAS